MSNVFDHAAGSPELARRRPLEAILEPTAERFPSSTGDSTGRRRPFRTPGRK